jgi:formylglycine-generating enzyme required for sulfatase activity
MPRWFLSYNSQDLPLMQRLEAALRRKDSEVKIFFAPTSLRAGGFWLPELAKGLTEATAFVLLVGEKGLGPWQVIEYYEALDRRVKQHDFPVIMVLLDGVPAPGLPFLRQLHWIVAADPASGQSVAQITDAAAGGGVLPGELWRHTAPYRGLAAMEEKDSDYFFGRDDKTVEVIRALEATPDKLPILLGNSGVGKSSLAQAGVLAALMRQAWPETAIDAGAWPRAFSDSRTWCVLTLRPGAEPVRALVEPFIRTWQFDPTDPRRETRLTEWIESLKGRGTLRGLLAATAERLQELSLTKPPAFLLYIDQGEELYVRATENERRRFSEIVAQALPDQRLRMVMSLRADFFGELQKDEPLYEVHRQINVPPLREAQLREVVSKPAALLGARFETERLAGDIAQRAAEDSSRDVGALPLLSYLLDDMWKSKDPKWDGVLRLPAPAIELGRVLVDRADAFIATHAGAEDALRRIFTLKLATVREDGEPTRRRAFRHEFSDDEWRLVSELADHPNRLIVTATTDAAATPVPDTARDNANVAQAAGETTYAEVAHEAIFRRWNRLREWIAAEREFLAWRSGLEAARRVFAATPDRSKNDALLMGFALAQAKRWLTKRREDLSAADREFIDQSAKVARARQLRLWALVGVLVAAMTAGVAGWLNQDWLKERLYVWRNVNVLTAAQEKALKPGDPFHECTECPGMIVAPAGSFMMGSPDGQGGDQERPQHSVTFARPFAVSKYELTFAEWDACATQGHCTTRVTDSGFGRGRQPVINVSWSEAKEYVAWLSKITGKTYRLLSDAEYEYAARAGTQTIYPWGNDISLNGTAMANCDGCSSKWDGRQPAPVGSFAPNKFGLYDMVGNVYEWTEDCVHENYQGAPTDGSPWIEGGNCDRRVVRGGAWFFNPDNLRSASSYWYPTGDRYDFVGFRVARTLTP